MIEDQKQAQLIDNETETYCKEILEENPELRRLHQAGGNALSVLMGKVMKECGGSCNPQEVRATLKRLLDAKE